MSSTADIIRETILGHLAVLFLTATGGDAQAARQAAARLLAAYHPETEDELHLAAAVINFSFHALEALSQSAAPDIPVNRVLRLRGSAVSLSRESDRAQQRLDRLQQARRDATAAPPAEEASATPPAAEKALAVVKETKTVAAAARAAGTTWTKAYQQRQRAARITANLIKNAARQSETAPPA